MNIYLIGYRCTGKTTVGKALAQRVGWAFVDTDQTIVESVGTSITRMVVIHGWSFFREQERHALETVAAGERQIVATGGGIILDDRNVAIMKTSGRIVWLRAGRKTIEARMLADDSTAANRPSLTGQGLMEEITSVLSARSPLYEKAAELKIETGRETVETVCDRIIAEFRIAEFRD